MLANKELLIALKQPVNFDRDQTVAAIDQTTGRSRSNVWPALAYRT